MHHGITTMNASGGVHSITSHSGACISGDNRESQRLHGGGGDGGMGVRVRCKGKK